MVQKPVLKIISPSKVSLLRRADYRLVLLYKIVYGLGIDGSNHFRMHLIQPIIGRTQYYELSYFLCTIVDWNVLPRHYLYV